MASEKEQTSSIINPTTYKTFYIIFQTNYLPAYFWVGFTKIYEFYKILTKILGLLLVCLVYYWIVHFRGGFSFTEAKIIFNWHPLLMTIGFIYLFANSILHYRSFPNNVKRKLKNQHAFIHSTVLILILVAGCAAYVSHVCSSPPIPNFYSLHSWLGIFTAVMFIIQFVSGLLFYLYPEVNIRYKEALAPYHVFFGIFIFALAVVTSTLGFSEKLIFALDKQYKLFPAEALFGNFLGVLCIIYGGLVVYMVTKPEFKRSSKSDYESLI